MIFKDTTNRPQKDVFAHLHLEILIAAWILINPDLAALLGIDEDHVGCEQKTSEFVIKALKTYYRLLQEIKHFKERKLVQVGKSCQACLTSNLQDRVGILGSQHPDRLYSDNRELCFGPPVVDAELLV